MKEKDQIELDTDAYVLYRHGGLRQAGNGKGYLAVENDEAFRVRQLLQEYRNFQNIPDNEMVNCVFLERDAETGWIRIISKKLENVRINELSIVWGKLEDDDWIT